MNANKHRLIFTTTAQRIQRNFFRQDKQDYQDSIFDSNYPVYPVNPVKFFNFDLFV